jgi:C4-dicarboxylate transporter DctQ subunit
MKKRRIILYEDNVSAICFLVMLVLLALGFISRFKSGFSFAFAEEIVVQLFLCLTMFSVSSCLVDNMHMGMSLFSDMLHGRAKKVSIILVFVISDLMFIFLFLQGIKMVTLQLSINLTTPILELPQWVFTLCIPIGSVLFLIRSVQKLINDLISTNEETLNKVNDK